MIRLAPSTLRVRIFALILLAVIPSMGLLVYVALDQQGLTRERAESESIRIARLVAAHEDQAIDAARQLLAGLSGLLSSGSLDAARIERTFQQLRSGEPRYVFLAAADPHGRILATSRPARIHGTLAGATWFENALAQRSFSVGAPPEAAAFGATLICAQPVRARSGQTRAVLLAGLTLELLPGLVPGVELPPGAVLKLVDRDGFVLARYPRLEVGHWSKLKDAESFWAHPPGATHRLLELPGIDGVKRLYACEPLRLVPDERVIVCYGVPKGAIFAAAERTFLKSIVAIALIGILVILVAKRNARHLVVRPVEELLEATRRLGAGAPDAQVGAPYSLGELGELGRAFDEMAATIRAKEEALRASEMRFRALIEHSKDAMALVDPDGRLHYVSPSATSILGYRADVFLGKVAFDLIHPDDQPRVRGAFNGLLSKAGGSIMIECRMLHMDGIHRSVEAVCTNLLHEPNVRGIVINFRDVTERRRSEQVLRTMTLIDELTGLYNRRGFLAFAEQQVRTADRTGNRLWLLFADLDGLKKINDTFGHTTGDQALVETAQLLKKTFRESDVIGRIGGDEFAVLAVETARGSVEAMIARFDEQVAGRNREGSLAYTLSISVGSARYDPRSPCSLEELIAEGDAMMYERKRARRRA